MSPRKSHARVNSRTRTEIERECTVSGRLMAEQSDLYDVHLYLLALDLNRFESWQRFG